MSRVKLKTAMSHNIDYIRIYKFLMDANTGNKILFNFCYECLF